MSRAVIYLRVSTKDQAKRGGEAEGFSIPAQREACTRKAEQLGAEVTAEFIDAGESARSSARPELQRMLESIDRYPVDYVIVHKVDRLARNRADDVAIHMAIQRSGASLVSASENIDETASGMLLHGIMSSIAEFYSKNLATEVLKGMEQKARTGGTPGRAPLGYRNVSVINSEGKSVRTVDVDPDRGPHITWAFQQYATGDWTLSLLADALEDRGLTSRPTRSRPGKAIRINSLQKILRTPYYKGEVVYRGVNYPGRHEPLVDPQTWQQVQTVLGEHASGEKQREHPHYLKSSVFCRSCGSRLIITMSKNRYGTVYPYFICVGRHQKRTSCHQKAMLIEVVEGMVEDLYQSVQLTADQRASVEEFVVHELATMQAESARERKHLNTQRDRLTTERTQLLRAHYAGAVPLDLLKDEQDRISRQLAAVENQLTATVSTVDALEANLELTLKYAENCHYGYLAAQPHIRRLYNQAFFDRIEVGDDEATGVLNEPFNVLCTVSSTSSLPHGSLTGAPENSPDHEKYQKPTRGGVGLNEAGLVRLRRSCSNTVGAHRPEAGKDVTVPPAGFEPATFCSGGRRSIP